MAWATMALDRALFETLDLDSIERLAVQNASYFKAEKSIDVDKAEGLASIDREWTDRLIERPHRARDSVSAGIGDGEHPGSEPGQINVFAVESVDRIVRARVCLDLCDDIAGSSIDDIPEVTLEIGGVNSRAVRRNRHPVAASIVCAVP